MPANRNAQRKYPPLSREVVEQLRADAADLVAAARRKGYTLNGYEEREERETARLHFDLGLWLHYYANRIGKPDGLADRIDCAVRIFRAGIVNPGYRFFTVFDFGERQFDTLVEMGDAGAVVDGVRQVALATGDPNLLRAFKELGWSLAGRQSDLFR